MAGAYRIASMEVVLVVEKLMLVQLLAKERKRVYWKRKAVKKETLVRWERELERD